MGLTDIVFGNPVLYGALSIALVLLARYQRTLGPDDDWVERLRNYLFYRLDPITSKLGFPLLGKKGTAEYIASVDVTPEQLEPPLDEAEWDRNLASFEKYRVFPDGTKEKTASTWALRDSLFSDTQEHIYIFPGHGDYGADIYGHGLETNWIDDPKGHLEDGHVDRHPERVLRNALLVADIEMERDISGIPATTTGQKSSSPRGL